MNRLVQKQKGQIATWTAIVLATVALGVSLLAYNQRKKTTLEPLAQESMQSAVAEQEEPTESLKQVALRTRLEARLLSLRARVIDEQLTLEEIEKLIVDIQSMRKDLQEAYFNATGKMAEQVQHLDARMELLEVQIRQSAADAVANIDMLISAMRRDVITNY